MYFSYTSHFIACSFQRDVNLGTLTTNCLHVKKYCNGAYSSQYVSRRLGVVVCVGLTAYNVFKFVQHTFLHSLRDWDETW